MKTRNKIGLVAIGATAVGLTTLATKKAIKGRDVEKTLNEFIDVSVESINANVVTGKVLYAETNKDLPFKVNDTVKILLSDDNVEPLKEDFVISLSLDEDFKITWETAYDVLEGVTIREISVPKKTPTDKFRAEVVEVTKEYAVLKTIDKVSPFIVITRRAKGLKVPFFFDGEGFEDLVTNEIIYLSLDDENCSFVLNEEMEITLVGYKLD